MCTPLCGGLGIDAIILGQDGNGDRLRRQADPRRRPSARLTPDHRRVKTIGLLGGMSGESSIEYCRFINEYARERLGGRHSAPSLMFSFDFDEIKRLQRAGDWERPGDRQAEIARTLERAG